MTTESIIKKTLGWVFVLAGIIIIVFTIINTANYFTGAVSFPELFSQSEEISESTGAMNDLMQNMISKQLNSFISPDSINLLLNMSAWTMFAFFMVYAGAKIFELGLKFMKE